MQVYTLPDITPNGAVVNLGTAATSAGTPVRAVWVNMTASGTSIRVGDASIGAARGQALPTGLPFLVAPVGESIQEPYDLAKMNIYAGSGSDKVSITYGY